MCRGPHRASSTRCLRPKRRHQAHARAARGRALAPRVASRNDGTPLERPGGLPGGAPPCSRGEEGGETDGQTNPARSPATLPLGHSLPSAAMSRPSWSYIKKLCAHRFSQSLALARTPRGPPPLPHPGGVPADAPTTVPSCAAIGRAPTPPCCAARTLSPPMHYPRPRRSLVRAASMPQWCLLPARSPLGCNCCGPGEHIMCLSRGAPPPRAFALTSACCEACARAARSGSRTTPRARLAVPLLPLPGSHWSLPGPALIGRAPASIRSRKLHARE